jgi:protein KRI1
MEEEAREKLKGLEEGNDNECSEDEEESSSEEEDEGELLTPGLDLQIHQTLEKIRRKDPVIYARDAKFYHSQSEDDSDEPQHAEKKDKRMSVKDVLTKQMMEDNQDSDEEDQVVSHVAQQAKAKNAFLQAGDEVGIHASMDFVIIILSLLQVDDGDEDIFSKRTDPNALDEEEYKAFVAEQEKKEVAEKVSLKRLVSVCCRAGVVD